ncbi:MAG: hypothetical protein DDT36_01758 [Firmicutes bacterium]|nr:hypothetical protein [Bacillota bacterium]
MPTMYAPAKTLTAVGISMAAAASSAQKPYAVMPWPYIAARLGCPNLLSRGSSKWSSITLMASPAKKAAAKTAKWSRKAGDNGTYLLEAGHILR